MSTLSRTGQSPRRIGRGPTGRRMAALALSAITVLALAACGEGTPSGTGGGEGGTLVFWTLEDTQDRIDATNAIVARFEEQSDIDVEVVAIAEGDFATQLTGALANDSLPDVFGALPLGFTHGLVADDVADLTANAAVVESLGRDTFSQSALDLVTAEGGLAGVPSDSWAQLLVYRKDLFDAAGLAAPTTFDTIMTAAETLNNNDQAGIVLATGNDLRIRPADVRVLRGRQWLRRDRLVRSGDDRVPAVHRDVPVLHGPGQQRLGGRRPGRGHHAGRLLRRAMQP